MLDQPTDFEMGLIRGVALATTPGSTRFIKLYRAVSRAARALGCWSDALEEWLADEEVVPNDDVMRFYERCVLVIRHGVYIEGQGNYGGRYVDDEYPELTADYPPAHPKCLDCRLTQRGWAALG
jgi:hypothetical protein